MSELKARIALKHDTDANWASVATTFIPLEGEFIWYETSKRFKIGDGVSAVGTLDFLNEDELPSVSVADNGKVLLVQNGAWVKGDAPESLPAVSASDNDKVLMVVNGQWAVAELPASVASYDDLTDTPMSISEPTFTQEDSIGTGTFMGATWTKVSEKPYPVNELAGGTITTSGSTLVLTGTNVQDIGTMASGMGYTGDMATVITPSGSPTSLDFLMIALDAAWTLAAYGINMEAGTYIASNVDELKLPKSVLINQDYAGQILPNISDSNDGQTMEVIGGAWAVGGKHSIAGVEDWGRIQRVLRGNGAQAFPVWSQIRVPHKDYGVITFDVVSHNTDLDPNDNSRHTMTLLMRDALPGMQFDAIEALGICSTALSAGTYYYDATDSAYSSAQNTWQFTLTQSVPANGVLVFDIDLMNGYPTSISTYPSIDSYDAIETVAVTEGSSGTDISTLIPAANMNHVDRALFGSNNYLQSGCRQFIIGTGSNWWQRQTKFDRKPTYADRAGFLAGFPADFVAALVATEQVTNTNRVYEQDVDVSTAENPVTYTTTDKFFLASHRQLCGEDWLSDQTPEGTLWTAFEDSGTSDSDDRVKYAHGNRAAVQWWWQRSCHPDYSCYAGDVGTDGDPCSRGWACYPAIALAAACVIGAL